MLQTYVNYATGMQARQEVISWINGCLKNKLKKERLDQAEAEHIIDYLCSDKSPQRLMKMSYEEAKSNTDKWNKALQKKGKNIIDTDSDIEFTIKTGDGFDVVKLKTKKAFEREGYLMRHCLGSYNPESNVEIYSFRDSKNMPHATIEIRRDSEEINQIKGKGNGPIHPKYISGVLEFLKFIGKDIRPTEMRYLGYYHIPSDVLPLVYKITGIKDEIHEIRGEKYVHESC